MAVTIAEYLGVRTDNFDITPIPRKDKPKLQCPFRNANCDKLTRGQHPVCAVRDKSSNALWIVCSHRLCSSSPKSSNFTEHQVKILHSVAKTIFSPSIEISNILVKREVPIKVTQESSYSADFVMWRKDPELTSPSNPDRAVILEMQGGGETTNTGELTRQLDEWEAAKLANNVLLNKSNPKVAPLVTNAWRRQQEQFLVKGNTAMLTGGRMVFCVSSLIYNYLMARFREGILLDLKDSNWTLALISFDEDTQNSNTRSIPLKINRSLFTNYQSFVQVLTNQGSPCPEIFLGEYDDLSNQKHQIYSSPSIEKLLFS